MYITPARFFDMVFSDIINFNPLADSTQKYSRELFPVDDFPKSNVIVSKNKELIFEYALAGYNQEDIEISFEDDYMYITASRDSRVYTENELTFIRQGIASRKVRVKENIPSSKYDLDSAVASFNNGILNIIIPIRESAKPKKLQINNDVKNDQLLNE